MSDITRNKITDEEIENNGVQSQSDILTGTSEENKKVFDNLVTTIVKVKLSQLIDDLMSVTSGYGADSIGSAEQVGITGITVQEKTSELKNSN